MKENVLKLFLNSEEYKTLKTKYEQDYFKVLGDYNKYDGFKLTKLTAQKVAEQFKNKKITVKYEAIKYNPHTEKLETKMEEITENFYKIWSEDPDMKEFDEITFECDTTKVKPHQFNLFDGFNTFSEDIIKKSKKVDLSPIIEHIRSLVNYNEEHYNYVINYLSQLVQQPHILPHTSLIFISDEGVGKDIFSNFIRDSISKKYCLNTEKLDNICGKFNSLIGGKLLTTINETNPMETRERLENLKFLITAEEVTIEGKHKDPVICKNFSRFIFFSNRLFAFPVESGSRRPVIFKSSDKYLPDKIGKEENKKYFTNLAENICKSEVYQCAFLRLLTKRDISKWNPKDFTKSELHADLEENNFNPIVAYLASVIKENPDKEKIKISTVECLQECSVYLKTINYKFEITQAKFNLEMIQTFNVNKSKSNGYMFFEINIPAVKELLIKKYKYDFTIIKEEEEEKVVKKSPLDDNIEEEVIKKVETLEKSLMDELIMLRKFKAMYSEEYQYFLNCQSLTNKPKEESESETEETDDEELSDGDKEEATDVLAALGIIKKSKK